ncbi:MAG: hypothetical protein JRJ19_05620 [Deltaproteobacteria bacterium]|nr:hypothetical protein [Deltaproteobacteria bacterium]MBW1871521.1 hypothetical protein [Deltaproteobacteria bacterium]
MFKKFIKSLGNIVGRRGREPKSEEDERRELDRREAPRFEIKTSASPDENVFIEIDGHPDRYRVVDISTLGLAIKTSGGQEIIERFKDKELSATIVFLDLKIHLQVRALHFEGEVIGCCIDRSPDNWRRHIGGYLDPIGVGQKMKEVSPRFVKQGREGLHLRWYRAPPSCDFYLWATADSHVELAQLYFANFVVEWSKDSDLRTGEVDAPDDTLEGYYQSETFQFHPAPNGELLEVARRLLRASPVPEQFQKLFGIRLTGLLRKVEPIDGQ